MQIHSGKFDYKELVQLTRSQLEQKVILQNIKNLKVTKAVILDYERCQVYKYSNTKNIQKK